MPRRSKIIAVSLDPPEPVQEQKEETEAEQLTKLVEEVKDEKPVVIDDDKADEEVVVVQKKTRAKRSTSKEEKPPKAPRPKRASKATPVEAEMVPPIEPVLPVVEEPVEPVKMKKIIEKATCPDCGKNMSLKTLKYNHVYSCPSKKAEPANTTVNIPEALIEEEVAKRMTNNRKAKLEARQEKFNKLLVEAF
jgi:hypothetical protein